ncbi:dTDP-4-amino-4,6-dideoxygalactose transaminase [Thiohalorhabdus denitrificans]|uniref:dTDP-4-amino-4,6-dideoxygalactose transaminase n=2 Tax=Thiohalorhabdus denitrificans TaxID=381306 RepID=A0A1G5GTT5_9GAMM|nr:dTDP-4-amino-4,6-dideoxygalactose transaminase [Thiohalorhabdus denitrificans]
MSIPMVDLKGQMATLMEEVEPEIREVLETGQFIMGPRGKAFEEEAAGFLGVQRAVGVASGTDALHLALLAAGVGPGDEVITTPFTFAATAEAILYVGARPVFADVDRESYNLDPEAVAAAVTPRTRALLPVHLFGQPVDMEALGAVAEEHGLTIVEDCAQSFGAARGGRTTGAWGVAGAFSFFPSKNLGGAGDGGLITTNDEAVADRLLRLRNHGSSRPYYHDELGFNSRLDELQAVVLRAKLKRIRAYNEGRRRVAMAYRRHLADAPVTLPAEVEEGAHVYHQFVLQAANRDEIKAALQAADIASAVYYAVPLHRQPAFAEAAGGASCPVAEELAERVLALPMFPELAKEDVERIAAVVAETARP